MHVQRVENVRPMFLKFVKDAKVLYGVKNIGINFHLVTHMVQSTLDCGCAWTYSKFIPDSVNGV